jgi:hypothetical protein
MFRNSALTLYNALLTRFHYAPLSDTDDNVAIAEDDLKTMTEELAAELGEADKATEILARLAINEDIEESQELKKALTYLSNYFKSIQEIDLNPIALDDESEPEKTSETAIEAEQTPQKSTAIKIRTLTDAATAFYQIIDERSFSHIHLADVFLHASNILDKKTLQPTSYVSAPLSDEQIYNNQILELYNTLTETLAQKLPLATTTTNSKFAATVITNLRAHILDTFKDYVAPAERKATEQSENPYSALEIYRTLAEKYRLPRLLLSEINNVTATRELQQLTAVTTAILKDTSSEIISNTINNLDQLSGFVDSESPETIKVLNFFKIYFAGEKQKLQQTARAFPALTSYNTLRKHCDIEPLEYTDENNAKAQEEIQHLQILISQTLAKSPEEVTEALSKLTSMTEIEIDSENLSKDESAILAALNEHYHTSELMTAEAAEELQNKIERILTSVITQPDTLYRKLIQHQLTDLEAKILREAIRTLSPVKTPIEQYNILMHFLVGDNVSGHLTDTESNSAFAVTALADAISATTTTLQNQQPSATPAEIDTLIAHLINGKMPDQNAAKRNAIQAQLRQHLLESSHQALEQYNTLQLGSTLLPELLDNTVENNEIAEAALQKIFAGIENIIGEAATQDVLQRFLTVPKSMAEVPSDDARAALDYLQSHFFAANAHINNIEKRPNHYTRFILAIANSATHVTVHEKIDLLRTLSNLILARKDSSAASAPIAALAEYLGHQDISTEALGKNLIKELYALRYGAEELDLPPENTNLAVVELEEEEEKNTPAVKTPKVRSLSEEYDEPEERQRKKYERQPRPTYSQTTHPSASTDADDSDDEHRFDTTHSPEREKGERISLAQQLAEAEQESKEAPEKNAKEKLLAQIAANKLERLMLAQEREAREKIAIEQLRLQRKKGVRSYIRAGLLNYAKTVHMNQSNTPAISLIQQIHNGDAMPAGYLLLSQQKINRDFVNLLSDMQTDTTETPAIAPIIQIERPIASESNQEESKHESKDEDPEFDPLNHPKAMQERMVQYAMQLLPSNARTGAGHAILHKISTAYQNKIASLLELIQLSCSIAGKQVMADFTTALSKIFVQLTQKNLNVNFDHIITLQAAIIKQAAPYAKSSKNSRMKDMLTQLNENKTERQLIDAMETFNQDILHEGDLTERNTALALSEKTELLKTQKFSKENFLLHLNGAIQLANKTIVPSATETIIHKFLLSLPTLYVSKEEAAKALANAQEKLVALTDQNPSVAPSDITKANLLVDEAKINIHKAEAAGTNLRTAFKNFLKATTIANNAERRLVMTDEKIEKQAEAVTENFLERLNSTRLEKMKHTTLVILENLRNIYITALENSENPANLILARKDLFDEYVGKISVINTSFSQVDESEKALTELRTELLEKTGHKIDIDMNSQGQAYIEPSPIEDQRLRLLTSMSAYLHSLNTLKKALTPTHATAVAPIHAAAQKKMQDILLLNIKHENGQEKLLLLRAEIEGAAAGWQANISHIIEANKASIAASPAANIARSPVQLPLRAPRSLSLLEEARSKERLVAEKEKLLAGIFNASNQNRR